VHRREKLDATIMVAFIARGSEPTSGEAERSVEGGSVFFSPVYNKTIRQRGDGDERNKRFVVENLYSQ
jgi:hypothetical protein